MSRLIYPILFLMIVLISACSTDFDLEGEYKETAIIYGMLDPAADTQFVKITKGYFNENQTAIQSLTEYDSVYYDTTILVVELEELNENGSVERAIAMRPTTVISKDAGELNATSASKKHILYFTDATINEEYTYRLTVRNKNTGYRASAETNIVKLAKQPGEGAINDVLVSVPSNYPRDLGNGVDTAARQISFPIEDASPLRVTWKEFTNVTEYQCNVKIYYTHNGNKGVISYALFNRSKKLEDESSGATFYNNIANNFTADNLDKSIDEIGLEFTYANEELTRYIDITNAQTGLIQSQMVPEYTNIENGIGIFASKSTVEYRYNYFLQATLEEIECGDITGGLGFDFPGVTSCN